MFFCSRFVVRESSSHRCHFFVTASPWVWAAPSGSCGKRGMRWNRWWRTRSFSRPLSKSCARRLRRSVRNSCSWTCRVTMSQSARSVLCFSLYFFIHFPNFTFWVYCNWFSDRFPKYCSVSFQVGIIFIQAQTSSWCLNCVLTIQNRAYWNSMKIVLQWGVCSFPWQGVWPPRFTGNDAAPKKIHLLALLPPKFKLIVCHKRRVCDYMSPLIYCPPSPKGRGIFRPLYFLWDTLCDPPDIWPPGESRTPKGGGVI